MLVRLSILLTFIFVAFGLLVFGLRNLRRRANRKLENVQTDFAIDELHRLMVEGKLSREEFERARASVLSRRKVVADAGKVSRRGFEVLEPRDPV